MSFPGDFGIIFKGTTGAPGTYVDVLGQTRDEVFLDAITPTRMPVDVTSAFVHAGLASRFALFVSVEVDGSVDLQLQGHYELDPTAPWADLFAFENYNPPSTAVVKTFTTSGTYVLQTANMGAVPEVSILVTADSGTDADITVRLVALS